MNKLFEAYIYRPNDFDDTSGVTIKLPATAYEILDGLERVRITDGVPYMEVMSEKLDCLPELIAPTANLYELNHLAERLSAMSDRELGCFEGMVMMEAAKAANTPITLERLINMTHSLADCHVVYEAHDDASLGKFYADNGAVPELEALSEEIFSWLDYAKIGKEMREAEGGVFTPSGYVVQAGEMSAEYSFDKLVCPARPDYVFQLELSRYPFKADPQQADITLLELPATDDEMIAALGRIGSHSLQDCAFYDFESIVPQITGALFADMDNFQTLNELAQQIQILERNGNLAVYKAMLEAAPEDITLEEALDLAEQTPDFSLLRELASPDEYARAALQKCDIPMRDELIAHANLWEYGKKLMEQSLAVATDYGILCANDGMTVEQCLGRSAPEHTLTFG